MHGAPKYPDGFAHFDYVNPDAPKGGTLHLGVVGTFDSLNPFIVRGTIPQAPAFSMFSSAAIYEPLMARSWDEPFSLYGLIAQSMDMPDDRSSVTFTLRPEAHWQDGQPITVDDVLFSFTTLRDQGRPNHRTYYKNVEKAEKIGPRTVRFSFYKQADGAFNREMPLIMGLMPILPAHDWGDRVFNQTTLRPPVASGPYKITKVDPGRSLTLTRDPKYWGRNLAPEKGMYNFDTVVIDYYRDENVALQAFKAGQFDLRREPDPRKWASSYDGPALSAGHITLARFTHGRPEAVTGFILNTRRPLFQNPALREAVALAFDFGWINKTLFHGFYKRTESFFPNSELAAGRGLPEGAEKALLERYRKQMAATLFTQSVTPPETDGSSEARRVQLLQAAEILKKAGYELRDGVLWTPKDAAGKGEEGKEKKETKWDARLRGHDGGRGKETAALAEEGQQAKGSPQRLADGAQQPVLFEVMLADPTEEKIALEWARDLQRLGITVRVRTVDSAQYQARLTGFDYDVTTGRWFNSLSPGNEQIFFWGCAAASQNGSRNYPGICDPVVDALAKAVPAAKTRAELVSTVKALDRVLMAGHYVVPFYYLGADQVAYWPARVAHPVATPLYGQILETWWAP